MLLPSSLGMRDFKGLEAIFSGLGRINYMLTLKDLYVGRQVVWYELQEIYDTYIVLRDCKGSVPYLCGTVVGVSQELTPEVRKLVRPGGFCVYNDSSYRDARQSFREWVLGLC